MSLRGPNFIGLKYSSETLYFYNWKKTVIVCNNKIIQKLEHLTEIAQIKVAVLLTE